jgi:integrase
MGRSHAGFAPGLHLADRFHLKFFRKPSLVHHRVPLHSYGNSPLFRSKSNLDLDRGVVRIVESLEQTSGGLRFKPPKSDRARAVTLPGFAVDELRRLRREQAESLLVLGVRQTGATLVCTQPNARPISPKVLTNYFARVAKRLGLPIHFHSLRHTHATQLLLAGVHPKVAQERLGHATVAMTLDIYSHVTERLRDDAAVKIDAVFRGAESSQKGGR